MSERLIVVSSDCHAGLPIADYKPYVESKYHEIMDMAVPVTIEMLDKAADKGLPASPSAKPSERAAAKNAGDRRGRGEESALEVTEVRVLPAGEEPVDIDEGTAADIFPGIKDAHEDDDEGWMARWLEKPTWDRRVTPNVIKRTGGRPRKRR